jgi:hypothetical protein
MALVEQPVIHVSLSRAHRLAITTVALARLVRKKISRV